MIAVLALKVVECVAFGGGILLEFRENNADLVVPLRCADPSLYNASHNGKVCSPV
jgi:hypothetical protein